MDDFHFHCQNCKFFIDFLKKIWKALRHPGDPPSTHHVATPLQALLWWTSLPPDKTGANVDIKFLSFSYEMLSRNDTRNSDWILTLMFKFIEFMSFLDKY